MRVMDRLKTIAEDKARLNKLDPGSLLGRVVYLLEKHGLSDEAKEVRRVSTMVQRAWKRRND